MNDSLRSTLAILGLAAAFIWGVAACLETPIASAHLPKKEGATRIEHGANALFWLERHKRAVDVKRWRASYRGHHWLFFAAMRSNGYLGPLFCIKRKEAGWFKRDLDTGRTYFGGLQMDKSFQRAHGPRYLTRFGYADEWPIWAQLHTAYRAIVSGRGYSPWPTTRKGCA